jgi:hypothetical protein
MQLREAGVSFEKIAETLGYRNRSSARKAVLAGLKAARLEPAKFLRQLELRRLDKLGVEGDFKFLQDANTRSTRWVIQWKAVLDLWGWGSQHVWSSSPNMPTGSATLEDDQGNTKTVAWSSSSKYTGFARMSGTFECTLGGGVSESQAALSYRALAYAGPGTESHITIVANVYIVSVEEHLGWFR